MGCLAASPSPPFMLIRAPDPVCDDVIVSTGQPANQARKFQRVSVFRLVMTVVMHPVSISISESRRKPNWGHHHC